MEKKYFKGNVDFISGQGCILSEFIGDVATRQINIVDGEYYASSSLLDKNEQVGFLLYDGKKSDLDLSDSEEISNEEFESVWMDSLDSFKEKNRIKYLSGDAVKCLDKSTVIAHIVNNKGKWGKGFVLSLSKKYPASKKNYHNNFKDNGVPELGKVDFVMVDDQKRIFVANMFAQDGIKKNNNDNNQYVCYEFLDICLAKLSDFALMNRLSVQMPRIGAGLGGGDWSIIESLILKNICYKMIDCTVLTL
ncbi:MULTISPECIES: macro domain-containing protein [Enterobacter]|uniref:macro domain-containing protein n=1 Tax=Enterobacter TaxID=547 RepID=UPI00125E013E|nr:macro domain-containing protein [Enterobacter sp. 198]ELY2043299.1 macro domain-containing protein [Enterobacter ludwigii]KAB5479697.1 Appr-1-p processing protein [Enterobacter sp. 198]